MIFICKIKLKILANVNKVILKKNWYSNKQLYVRCFNLYIFYFVQAVTNVLFMLLRMKNYFEAIHFIIICISRKDLITFGLNGHCCQYYLRWAYTMKFFFHRWLNFFFDSFFSTFDACIQLRNVNEIFQSTIMKVFQKKTFLPDF